MTRLLAQFLYAEFAAALTNPIAYQSELEKRAKQLSVLEDDAANDVSAVHQQGSVVQVRLCSYVLSVCGLADQCRTQESIGTPQLTSSELDRYVLGAVDWKSGVVGTGLVAGRCRDEIEFEICVYTILYNDHVPADVVITKGSLSLIS